MELTNTEVVNARAESLPQKFDYVVSRAVASLTDFYPWVKGRYGKRILYLRGGDIAAETAELCGRHKVNPARIATWPLAGVLKDDYFDGKWLVDIHA